MKKQLRLIRRAFSNTAYTWGNTLTNGWKGKAKISAIEPLRGQVEQIEFAPSHSAIVTSSGDLYTWGNSGFGKLGLNVRGESEVGEPTLVPFFRNNGIKVKRVALGQNHTLALDTKGRVFSFGQGASHRNRLINFVFSRRFALGHPKAEDVFAPKLIEKLRDQPVSQISTGQKFALALAETGELLVWGSAELGALGCRDSDVAEPVVNPVIGAICKERGTSVKKIDSCSEFSSVLFSDGTVWSFGSNVFDTMGLGDPQIKGHTDYMIKLPAQMEFPGQPQRVADVDLAYSAAAVLTERGQIFTCGQSIQLFPELLPLNYGRHKVRTFGACDRGVAVVTADNKLFAKGKFWINEGYREDANTGIKEIDAAKYFAGHEIVKVGGKYTGQFALVKEKN